MTRVYLDTAAATPLDKIVSKKMRLVTEKIYGNPSSLHQEGLLANQVMAEARAKVARILTSHQSEIIFTGSGTESNNLAIFGVANFFEKKNKTPGHIIVSAIEHHSVLFPARALKKRGWQLSEVPVTKTGLINPAAVERALQKNTVLISINYVNNEIGTVAPLKAIAKIIRAGRKHQSVNNAIAYPYFHTDACQAARFFPLSPLSLGVDLMTLNGSKIYGPKGTGILFVKRGVKITPLILGGGQEERRRSGTENVPALAGLAEALVLADSLKNKESARLLGLRDYAIAGIQKIIPDSWLNGDPFNRSPNNINFTFPGALAETLVIELDIKGIAVSTGSACSTNHRNESHVIAALRSDKNLPLYSLRFTLGRETTKRDIDYLLKTLPPVVKKLRRTDKLEQSLTGSILKK